MEQKVFLFMSFPLWFGSSGYEPTVLYLAANGDHAQRQRPQRNRGASSSPNCFYFLSSGSYDRLLVLIVLSFTY